MEFARPWILGQSNFITEFGPGGILILAGLVVVLLAVLANQIGWGPLKVIFRDAPVWRRVVGAVVGLLIAGFGVWLLSGIGVKPPIGEPPEVKRPKYDFESEPLLWQYRGYDSVGCTEVRRSKEKPRNGNYSMSMKMDLVGEDDERKKGEAFVNWQDASPPRGVSPPADLTNRTITAHVYAPSNSVGDPKAPNGFQIFVKNEGGEYLYGAWKNSQPNRWLKISLTVGKTALPEGEVHPDFDPTQIVEIGVKMAINEESTSSFPGVIYVDDIDW